MTVPVLTVEQLIAKLQKVEDKTLPVTINGCDCSGDAGYVHPDGYWSRDEGDVKFVVIGRTDQYDEEDPEKRGDL